MLDYLLPRYKVLRDAELCVQCGACERSCANEVHKVDEELGRVTADHRACVKLPALRDHVPCRRAGHRAVAAGWQRLEQLDARRHAGRRRAGADRRGAAGLRAWQRRSRATTDLLGPLCC